MMGDDRWVVGRGPTLFFFLRMQSSAPPCSLIATLLVGASKSTAVRAAGDTDEAPWSIFRRRGQTRNALALRKRRTEFPIFSGAAQNTLVLCKPRRAPAVILWYSVLYLGQISDEGGASNTLVPCKNVADFLVQPYNDFFLTNSGMHSV